jgi:hypothetical protein
VVFVRSVADGLAPHEEPPAGAYCESIIYIFFLFVSEKGKTLFMFTVILICVVYTELIQSVYTSLVFVINLLLSDSFHDYVFTVRRNGRAVAEAVFLFGL